MLASVHTTLTQLGAANGLLYLLAVALGRISGHRIRLYRYLLVGQPVPPDSTPMCRPTAKNPIREVKVSDPIVAQFPRPPQVIAKRFADGATCLVAEARERFAGFLWLAHGGYDEDEVRCRYEFAVPEQSVWDFDVYVEPEFRIGRTFSRLWDEANRRLAAQGVRWSYSRISAFNPNSLSVHGRMGARKLFSATFLCIGQVQITVARTKPYLHLGLSKNSRPKLTLSPSA